VLGDWCRHATVKWWHKLGLDALEEREAALGRVAELCGCGQPGDSSRADLTDEPLESRPVAEREFELVGSNEHPWSTTWIFEKR
jgi:hypothetical protein